MDYLTTIGAVDQLRSLDANTWVHAMMNESDTPDPFWTEEFQAWADDVLLTDFNITQDASEVRDLYIHLSQKI